MKSLVSLKERLTYLKRRVSDQDIPSKEKMEILEFFIYHAGLFGRDLDLKVFLKELNRLTKSISPK
jgi:hypothetical protein